MDLMQMQAWAYIPDLPHDTQPIRDLLLGYSKIPPQDVSDHLLRIVSIGTTFDHLITFVMPRRCHA